MDIPTKQPILEESVNQLATLDQSEIKSGIEVVCRIRPKFTNENYVSYNINTSKLNRLEINETSIDNEIQNQKTFSFTRIYDQKCTQDEIHQEHVIPLIKDMFEKNKGGLVFSYGVTNSGKTYTIIGNNDNPGLLPLTLRCLEDIKVAFLNGEQFIKFDHCSINLKKSQYQGFKLVDLAYSFQSLEIYNEDIYDLLPDKNIGTKSKLQLKEVHDRKYQVKEANEIVIDQNKGFYGLLNKALHNRQMGETTLNTQSSRSHTIFKVFVSFTYSNESYTMTEKTTLCIVDLAGSERSKKAETQGSQLTEACNINKSLLVLGKCLKQMRNVTESVFNRIPFRECKLTRLLSEYFTDDNRILMLINVKLTKEYLDETLKVLHYGALSVHVNLLKTKIYQSTICFANRLQAIEEEQQLKQLPKKNQIDIIKKAKMLVQNNTINMLFQQNIQSQLVESKLKKIQLLETEMRNNYHIEVDHSNRNSRRSMTESRADIPQMESDKKLHKSLERLKKNSLSSSISNLNEISQQPQEYIQNTCFSEEIQFDEKNEEQANTSNQQIVELSVIHEYDQLSQSQEIGMKLNLQESTDINNKNDDNNDNNNLVSTPTRQDQCTNTTPFDEMKQKIFSQLIGYDQDKHQQERQNFKQDLMKNLLQDLDGSIIDKENSYDISNIGNQSGSKIMDKFASASKLKIIDEQDIEHDLDENALVDEKKKGKTKKPPGKKRKGNKGKRF